MSIHAVRAFGLLYKHTFHKKVRIKYNIISSTAKFSRDRNHNQSVLNSPQWNGKEPLY